MPSKPPFEEMSTVHSPQATPDGLLPAATADLIRVDVLFEEPYSTNLPCNTHLSLSKLCRRGRVPLY